jgi:hypothetical protein
VRCTGSTTWRPDPDPIYVEKTLGDQTDHRVLPIIDRFIGRCQVPIAKPSPEAAFANAGFGGARGFLSDTPEH